MSLTLSDVIKAYFVKIIVSDFLRGFTKRSEIAALILAEIYEIYENSKDKKLLVEIKFFLNIKNPMKHLINILENSSTNSGNTIEWAVMNEFKLLNKKDKILKLSLYSILNDFLEKEKLNMETFDLIVLKLREERIKGNLDEDAKNFFIQRDFIELLTRIINNDNRNDALLDSIEEIYLLLEERKLKNVETELLKEQIIACLQENCFEIHNHLDHIGKTTFELVSIKKGSAEENRGRNHRRNRGRNSINSDESEETY